MNFIYKFIIVRDKGKHHIKKVKIIEARKFDSIIELKDGSIIKRPNSQIINDYKTASIIKEEVQIRYNFKQKNYKNSTRNSCIPFSKSYQLLNILAHLKNHSLIFLYTRFSLEPLRLRQYCSFHSQILHCIRTRSFSCIIHSSVIKPSTLTMI